MNLRKEHNMKLVREISKRGSYRIVSRWNDLSQSVVNAETVNSFKSGIDKEVFGMVQRKRRKTATAQLELNAAVLYKEIALVPVESSEKAKLAAKKALSKHSNPVAFVVNL
ncbi:hypothetical protein BpHYR1_032281 [Brachionus plicatilis]|uniref:RNA-directed DNA polymerase from mobile element jockey-like n=1 Tax=Brachionus plicatilis TaxID=10195 RepID=A0A3M7P290_BRAPC|nr:hypothetical protein BpHYR1_032281 [Brachionus plicatilis]